VPAAAQAPVTVKMATLVPENSSWFNVLKDVADKWNKASGGKVRVILYAGGRQGDDPDVVRKMNLGSLNAGVLTSVGVAEIDKSVYALGVPMAFDNYEEVYAVLEKMRPRLESTLEAKGYVKLADTRTYAPLSFIGLVSSQETMKRSPQKVQGMIAALHRTMNYILNPANRSEVVQYVATYHKIDLALAEKAMAAQMLGYSKDGTKPRAAVEKEIEIYRESLKVAKAFTPDDLEDMSWLRKVQGR